MTEDEAKTKWCPHSRVMSNGAGVNRDRSVYIRDGWTPGEAVRGGKCLGSDCMMWRWTNEVTGRGFCGLAGSVGLK